MNKKIKLETNKEELNLIRKAVASYLEELEERKDEDCIKLEKIYNKLVDLTFKEEE